MIRRSQVQILPGPHSERPGNKWLSCCRSSMHSAMSSVGATRGATRCATLRACRGGFCFTPATRGTAVRFYELRDNLRRWRAFGAWWAPHFADGSERYVACGGRPRRFGWGPKGRWSNRVAPTSRNHRKRGGFAHLGHVAQVRRGVHLGSNFLRELPGVGPEHPDQEQRCAATASGASWASATLRTARHGQTGAARSCAGVPTAT